MSHTTSMIYSFSYLRCYMKATSLRLRRNSITYIWAALKWKAFFFRKHLPYPMSYYGMRLHRSITISHTLKKFQCAQCTCIMWLGGTKYEQHTLLKIMLAVVHLVRVDDNKLVWLVPNYINLLVLNYLKTFYMSSRIVSNISESSLSLSQ